MQPDGVLFPDDRRPCYGHLGPKDFKRNNNNNNNKKAKQNKGARVSFSTRLTRITERELEIKKQPDKQRRQISLETKHENFIAVVRKWEMLAASKVNMSGIEKQSEQEHKQSIIFFFVRTYDISFVKRVPRKFHAVVVQKQRQRNVQKNVLYVQSTNNSYFIYV